MLSQRHLEPSGKAITIARPETKAAIGNLRNSQTGAEDATARLIPQQVAAQATIGQRR